MLYSANLISLSPRPAIVRAVVVCPETGMGKVWFHRSRAACWVILGACSFLFGWSDSVTLVWIASLYANVVSDWAAAEAADHRDVIDRLERIERALR